MKIQVLKLTKSHGKKRLRTISFATVTPSVQCNFYEGTFNNQRLQDLADLELWETTVIGNPHVIKGQGNNVQHVIHDSIQRTKDKIKNMQAGLVKLEDALKNGDFENVETIIREKPTL